jgi:CRP/FNR family cyclic AMP-dependent transcriptional regulator
MQYARNRIQLLQAMPFFGAITDDSVELILQLSETLLVKKNELFYEEGQRGDSLYILEQGRAVIFKRDKNREYILRHAEKGSCFGELALIDIESRYATVRAESDCTAIKVPSSALHRLYQSDAEQYIIIQMNMAREVGRRLRAADERWFQLQKNSSTPNYKP